MSETAREKQSIVPVLNTRNSSVAPGARASSKSSESGSVAMSGDDV
ncbi:MAG TPA: hypothetical protein VNX86_15635 [Rhizomicrobium sp.]|nr:hypothetical protein [Rhizomicrobium sp.]